MNPIFFENQIKRLISRFGQKAFDPEFVRLVWSEVLNMSETGFERFVSVLIGSRTSNKPPLLSEFREARLAEEKLKLQNETRAVARALDGPAKSEGLRKLLSEKYGKVSSVWEAVEIERIRARTDNENEPEGAA